LIHAPLIVSHVRAVLSSLIVQHYVYPNPFHSTRPQFEAQRARDALKVCLCEQNGIRLIVVPYTVEREEIGDFLRAHVPLTLATIVAEQNEGYCARAATAAVVLRAADGVVADGAGTTAKVEEAVEAGMTAAFVGEAANAIDRLRMK